MNLGYARISKAAGSQTLDLQLDALAAAGVTREHVYQDEASGKRDDRPGLEACLKALRAGDIFYVWKLLYSGNPQLLHRHLFSFRLPKSGTWAA